MNQKQLIVTIDEWLASKNSPMVGFTDFSVILARYHGISLTLTTAIAQAETQCAIDIPTLDLQGHNAWGYGHPPGSKHGYAFATWPDGISAVTQYLAQAYVGQGLTTVEAICPKWVGSFSQGWIDNVKAVMMKFGGDPEHLARAPLARPPQ